MSEYTKEEKPGQEQEQEQSGGHKQHVINSSSFVDATTAAVKYNTPETKTETESMPPPSSIDSSRRHRSIEYRAERNAREKERSLRITQQIEELRLLLHDAGMTVPKSTKGAILSATIQYIHALERQ